MYFRSAWEANYARYLNLLLKLKVITSWEYEPKTFWFEKIRRGVRSYKPDFAVQYAADEHLTYIEVKGWKTPKDETKWKRMAKYYPEVRLEIVDDKAYRAIKRKWSTAIPTWESASRA